MTIDRTPARRRLTGRLRARHGQPCSPRLTAATLRGRPGTQARTRRRGHGGRRGGFRRDSRSRRFDGARKQCTAGSAISERRDRSPAGFGHHGNVRPLLLYLLSTVRTVSLDSPDPVPTGGTLVDGHLHHVPRHQRIQFLSKCHDRSLDLTVITVAIRHGSEMSSPETEPRRGDVSPVTERVSPADGVSYGRPLPPLRTCRSRCSPRPGPASDPDATLPAATSSSTSCTIL